MFCRSFFIVLIKVDVTNFEDSIYEGTCLPKILPLGTKTLSLDIILQDEYARQFISLG